MTVNASKDWIQQLYIRETTKKLPEPDFYKDDMGNIVMTESYHIKRGSCCGSKCTHCPFDPKWEKGSTQIRESLGNPR
jgi:hypothetical protein